MISRFCELLTTTGWDLPENCLGKKVAQYINGGIEFCDFNPVVEDRDELVNYYSFGNKVNITVSSDHIVTFVDYKGRLKSKEASNHRFNCENKLITAGKLVGGDKESLSDFEKFLVVWNGSRRFRFDNCIKNDRFIEICELNNIDFKIKTSKMTLVNYEQSLELQKYNNYNWININEISYSWAKEFIENLIYWNGNKISENYNIIRALCVLSGFTTHFWAKKLIIKDKCLTRGCIINKYFEKKDKKCPMYSSQNPLVIKQNGAVAII